MSKNQFSKLVVCTVAGLLFSIGLCMCLLPEWDSFNEGVILASVGGVILLVIGAIAYFKSNRERTPINWGMFGKVSYAIISSLVLGAGMCLVMVWEQMMVGILLGIVGIVMLLFLIPMFFGLKK